MKLKSTWKFKVILHFSPLDIGYQKLQADHNMATVMEILVQMPSHQGKRKGKKDYMNHLTNYGESRRPGRRPGAWQNRWGGAQEKFKEIRDFNNFDHQGLQLDAELFLTYCKPWEQKQMREETHISHSDCFSFLKLMNRKEMKPSWGSLPQIWLRVPPRLPFWTPGGGRYSASFIRPFNRAWEGTNSCLLFRSLLE